MQAYFIILQLKKNKNNINFKTGNTNYLNNAKEDYKNLIKKIKSKLKKSGVKVRDE